MPVSTQTSIDGHTHEVRITGRFDFSVHREFRDTYRNVSTPGHLFRLDLSGAEYMDSSALGMLLLMQEHLQGHEGIVRIVATSDTVRRILEIASFDKIFEMDRT